MDIEPIPIEHQQMLYKLAKDISNVFESHNIQYWIDGGTLLGSLRERGLILHDDDIDFGVFENDYKKILKKEVLNEIINLGYRIQVSSAMLKVFVFDKWTNVGDRKIATPTLDIFLYGYRKIKNNTTGKYERFVALKHDSYYIQWKMAKHKKSDLLPLKKVKFGELILNAPKNGIPYCNGLYPNWRTTKTVQMRDSIDPTQKTDKIF